MTQRLFKLEDYTVGWISALPLEFAAATAALDEEHDVLPADADEDTLYTFGSIGGHNIVIACLPAGQTGANSAATIAARMKTMFKSLRFGLMVGIGGGVPSDEADVRLGDVVVSQPYQQHGGVVQYDFGKDIPGGFVRTGSLAPPPPLLLGALAKAKRNRLLRRDRVAAFLAQITEAFPDSSREDAGLDRLFKADYKHAGGSECKACDVAKTIERPARKNEVEIHYGTIACANKVMRDAEKRDRISKELGGVLCFEMEAAGLMNNFPCIVIRGICDYADSHKNKKWQNFAAAVAAAYAKDLLSVISAAAVTQEPTAQRVMDTTGPHGSVAAIFNNHGEVKNQAHTQTIHGGMTFN